MTPLPPLENEIEENMHFFLEEEEEEGKPSKTKPLVTPSKTKPLVTPRPPTKLPYVFQGTNMLVGTSYPSGQTPRPPLGLFVF